MGLKNKYAIVGLGVTKQGRVPELSSLTAKTEAVRLAAADAGLKHHQIDGWIYQPGIVDMTGPPTGGEVPKILGMAPKFTWAIQAGGTSCIAGISAACAAIEGGMADYVAVAYGDACLSSKILVGGSDTMGFMRDTQQAYGMYSPGADHALAAMRHMAVYGTTKEQLGAIALTQREYAQMRPEAYMHGRKMTMDDYLNARPIADPLGKFDYCLTADGGSCFIVTSAERAKNFKNPVYIQGAGFGHAIKTGWDRTQYLELGIKDAADACYKDAGVTVDDIKVASIYDCFTITVLLSLEGYGFCKQGDAGPFCADGGMKLNGRIPSNTAGGELSWSYMQGFTPMVEGVRQMRGESGASQVDTDLCLVTGHGGTTMAMGQMEYAEAAMILRRG